MKINLIILLFIGFLISFNLQAVAEERQGLSLNEQVAVLGAKVDALNQRIDDLDKKMDARIEGINQRIEGIDQRIEGIDHRMSDLYNIVLSGFGILFAGMFILISFVIWDRRTVVAPISKQLKDMVRQEEFIIDVLRRYSKEEPKMAEAMKTVGL